MEMTQEVLMLRDGYDRKKFPEQRAYRRMTLEEIKGLKYGDHPEFVANDGTVRTLKINGAPKTWKTRPGDVSVPVKYGMYETARFETQEALDRFVVRI